MADDPAPAAEEEAEDAAPLPSSSGSGSSEDTAAAAGPVRAPPPTFKLSTFVYTFLFVMGIYMLFSTSTREAVAGLIGDLFGPVFGFGGSYVLLTMLLAAVVEMALTALAYNFTTDWVKAARVQSWSAAFRKVQMAAIRSGKKDRIEALRPHQQRLTALSSEVSMAQLKGMAVTWFLVIAIYTWVGLFVAQSPWVNIGGALIDLTRGPFGWSYPPLWFLVFTLYTVPSSVVLRRLLKHVTLRRYAAARAVPATDAGPAGGA